MRRTSGWAVFALAFAGAVTVGAKQPVPVPPLAPLGFGAEVPAPAPVVVEKADPKIVQLIADLGAEDYRTREKAGRDLAVLGEKALPGMRAALLTTENAEVQRRLTLLVRKMDNDRLVSPKCVTLNVKDKTAKEIYDEITKQTGYKVTIDARRAEPGEQKHSFNFENTPFWVAMDRVAAAAGCVVSNNEFGDDTIHVTQNGLNPYVAYSGPFRLVATNIGSNKNVQLAGINPQFGNSNRYENLNLGFQVQSEPKNPMLGIMQAELITAVDDLGGTMVFPRDPNYHMNNYFDGNRGMRSHNTYGNLNLCRGDKAATSIKALKGKMGITLLSGTAPEITVPDPLKVKAKSFIGRTVEMEFTSLTEDANNKGNYTLDVTIKKRGGENPNQMDYNWSNNIWNKIELLDAAGNHYQNSGPNGFNNNGWTVQMTLNFFASDGGGPRGFGGRRGGGGGGAGAAKEPKFGPPVKLVVIEWLSVTQEVTFEFKDIPLP